MPRPKQRTPQLREHVLRVALDMLESDGVAAFTARRIADGASTSMPALYELFGDKAGLVRELFFAGFRMLRQRFDALDPPSSARAGLVDLLSAFRSFVRKNSVLAQVMFSQPFSDFEPGPSELAAGASVREIFVARVRSCLDAGVLVGDETDIAHVLLALAQGLSAQESAGWMGRSKASVDRRWKLAVNALLDGLSPALGASAGGT